MDLFSGKVEFFKAGAAVSYVVRKGKLHRVDLSSLPAGILTEISFAKESYQLEAGDRLLMISDGVLAEGTPGWKGLLTWEDQGGRSLPKKSWRWPGAAQGRPRRRYYRAGGEDQNPALQS